MTNRWARAVGVALVLAVFVGSEASGQGLTTFLKATEIKKKFDSGKDEQEPAQIALIAPDGWRSRYVLVDVAGRLKDLVFATTPAEIFIAPVVEYHKQDAEPLVKQKAVNQLAASLVTELYFDPAVPLKPILFVRGSATRNFIDDVWERSASALLSFYSAKPWAPGRPITSASDTRLGRYVPYVGIEYFDALPIKSGSDVIAPQFSGAFVTLRIFWQAYPLNRAIKASQIRFSLEGDAYLRRAISGSSLLDDEAIGSASISAIYYVSDRQRFGISLTADMGRSPVTNFVKQQRVMLALRVKVVPG
jgi:hypothetical protein